MTEKELYKKAIETWGIEAQRMVFHEELAELFCILKGFTKDNLTEELADAIIMTEQMMFNYHVNDDVELNCFAIGEDMSDESIQEELESSYFQLNQTMSHYHRGRANFTCLYGDLRALWGWLMMLGIYNEKTLFEEVMAIRNSKLHRLAEMLGETFEAEA